MFPLFLCGQVKLQQIALVKDLSQELTNAGGTNHECSNEGDMKNNFELASLIFLFTVFIGPMYPSSDLWVRVSLTEGGLCRLN